MMAKPALLAGVVLPLLLLGGVAHGAHSEVASVRAGQSKARADEAARTATAAASADATAAELAKYKAAYTQADDQAKALALERDQLKAQLARATTVATACEAKNERLVAFSKDLLRTYRRASFGEVVAAREPFVGLQRVRLENLAQERDDTLRAAHCDPRLDGASAKPPAAG